MKNLAWYISGFIKAGYPVEDKTGLEGRYDFVLQRPEKLPSSGPGDSTTSADLVPPIFDMLKDQMGLELKLGKVPAEEIVIDYIERPSPN